MEHRQLNANELSLFPSSCLDSQSVLYKFEYHIIYSSSYQVPVLYFHICDQAGVTVSLEWLWRRISLPFLDNDTDRIPPQMVTQEMHPVSGLPFYAIHPCRTASLMAQLSGANEERYLIAWLSCFAPTVGLHLTNYFGMNQ